MSSRVTRFSARLAADPRAAVANSNPINPPTQTSTTSKKRKAPARPDSSPIQPSTEPTPQSSSRRSKRQKLAENPPQPSPTAPPPPRASRRRGAVTEPAMSNTGYARENLRRALGLIGYRTSSKHTEEPSKVPQATKTSSKRPSSRSKKSQGKIGARRSKP